MTKSTRYYVEPNEIKAYLRNLGYEIVGRNNYEGREVEFRIPGTTVGVSYDLIVNGELLGHGSLFASVSLDFDDPEKTLRSEKLYQKLKRKFGKPPE